MPIHKKQRPDDGRNYPYFYLTQMRGRAARRRNAPDRADWIVRAALEQVFPDAVLDAEVWDSEWTGCRGNLNGGWLIFTAQVEMWNKPAYVQITGSWRTGGMMWVSKLVQREREAYCARHRYPLLVLQRNRVESIDTTRAILEIWKAKHKPKELLT